MQKVEIGVIGAGWWACLSHIPNLLKNPHVASVAVNRPDEENLAKVLAHFGIEHGYTETARMLDERPVKGAVVASPHVLHAEHAVAALEKGLHVLVEKPMATCRADALRMTDAARANDVQIIMPYGWNYRPMADTAHRLLKDGWVGEVRHVSLIMASALADLFAGQPMVETADHLFRPPPSTWADPERAGGYGWGQLTHALGLLFRLVDLDPAGVYARFGRSEAGVDYFDAGIVEFANGATMTMSGAATVPKTRSFQVDVRIFGSEGMLLVDLERARVECVRHDGKEHIEDLALDAGSYDDYSIAEPINRLVDICRGETVENPADGIIGRRAVEVLDAMYRSADSGRMENAA
ncbi:MAG: Gfo/Idh/MocA family oxidoreductase [Albidovulum sp.]|nr:Gfo/Idh/MocA family oxidoreductase [Albidovulum sp.]MDE0531350.1 Gfo/Idh/MocA family oxidoreductase [Albidovulum sp.]